MPIRKLRLNRAEQAQHLASLRELRAAGVATAIAEELLENSRALDITVAGGLGSLVSESSHARVHYAVWVRLVARVACTLLRCRMTTKWDPHIVLNSYGGASLCKLGPLDYTEAEVLNQRIEESLLFSHPGDMVEGVILATGVYPIPQGFGPGMPVPFQLTFEDQFDNEINAEGELSVEREAKSKRATVRRGTGLYGPAAASRGVSAREDLGGPHRQHGSSSYLHTIEGVPGHSVRRAKADAEM